MIANARVRFLFGCSMALLTGCSVTYYDKSTGTSHLWGFGHLRMKAAPAVGIPTGQNADSISYITGTKTMGLTFGAGSEFSGLAAGWNSQSRIIVGNGASFYVVWPTNTIWLPQDLKDLFTVNVGNGLPPKFMNSK
jgi:hypothetical protein